MRYLLKSRMSVLKYFSCSWLIFYAISAVAQEESRSINPWLDYSRSVRLHIGRQLIHDQFSLDYIGYSTIAGASFQWRNKKYHFYEIGLNGINSNCEFPGKSRSVSLRFEFIVNFLKLRPTRWVPALGVGAIPFVNWYSYVSDVSTEFPWHQLDIGTRFFFSPRITYHYNKKLYFGLSAPFSLMKIGVETTQVKNPGLPIEQQKYTIINFDLNMGGSGISLYAGWKF